MSRPTTASLRPARRDLSTPTEVHDLVTAFYREVVFDELLEPVFGEIAEVDWAEHIPVLIDYWCHILFRTGPYAGSVTRTHRHLHELAPIGPEHCDRWYVLWVGSIDERWAGPHATHAATHAATLMSGLAKRVFGFAWSPPPGRDDVGGQPVPPPPTGDLGTREVTPAETVADVHRRVVGDPVHPPVPSADRGGEGPCLLELVEDQRDR